jgi:hypothetical protein
MTDEQTQLRGDATRAVESTNNDTHEPPGNKGGIEQLKVIGGLVAVLGGLLAILVIVCVALFKLKAPNTAVTGGITAIGSIVGAYFGVKVGSDGTKEAVQGQKDALKEVTKATEEHAAEKIASANAQLKDQKTHASALAGLALALPPGAKGDVLATIKEFQSALN